MKIEELKAKNGIRIIIVPNENATSTTVSISAGIGSDMEEKEISGLSHLAEHMMFKGTTKRPNPLEIIQEFDNLGSFYNAYTSREYTTYFAKSRPESLSKIFDLLADMYKNSSFNEKELTKEKGVVIEEIRMYNDQPDALANLLLRQIAYGDTPEGRSIAGSIETVSSATAEVLKEFRDKYYCAENTVVVVSGKLNKNEVMDLVEEKLGDLRSGGKIIHTREVFLDRAQNVKHHKKETEQTHVVIAFPSFKIGTEKDVKMTVLKYILGGGLSSRLSILLREELGASYYAYADNDSLRNYGLFEIAAGIKTEILNEAMEGIAKCLKNLKEELVTEIEMSRTIESLSGKIAIAMETTDSVANYVGARAMAEVELLTPQERIAEIRKVTKEDILKLANEIFIKENVKISIVGPEGASGCEVGFLENI
ncbi:MAG TPA: pitrilysin family protein [Candidatus Paceibacterota bacterium]|nr:pitrilysin family protein [Candidatus Paceibacterota bacterium]